MSDLPSRDEVIADLEGGDGIVRHNDECAVGVIAWAYVSGRLVDRESLRVVAYLDGDGAWKIDLEQLGGSDEK